MIMGLGTALFESNEFSEGQITNANLSDYNVPAMDDMPAALSHELVEREGGEVQGLGETALPPVPPAIGNALYSRGIHVTDLPISPSESSTPWTPETAEATPLPKLPPRSSPQTAGMTVRESAFSHPGVPRSRRCR